MKTQDTIIQSLTHTVRRHDSVYQRTREHLPALAPFPTASALFDALSLASPLHAEARQRLWRLVTLEYQRDRHPLWQALAIRALDPMLGGLRARLRNRDADEREQDLHLAFFEALGRLRLDRPGGPPFPLQTLRRAIARALFARDGAEAELGEEVAFDEWATECAPSPHEEPQPFVQCLAREVGELVVQQRGGEDAVRVLAGAETLVEQAERLSADPRSYDRVHKRHRRTLDRVRRELSRTRPRGGASKGEGGSQ